LTERQMRIVEYTNKHGKMNIADVAAMFKISRQAVLKEIGKLVDLDVVRRKPSVFINPAPRLALGEE
jgi:DeoR/GlpR family transcriptional regulator of sugar metabolism